MNCKFFEKYQKEKVSEIRFREHLRKCDTCKEKLKQDSIIMNLAQSIRKPVNIPDTWTEIEQNLKKRQTPQKKPLKFRIFSTYRPLLLKIAAVLIMAIIAGGYVNSITKIPESGILNSLTMKKVELKEREYIEAIAELEQHAGGKLNSMDMSLMLLYRDKLETINNQIKDCRKALQSNPANAHIRRYLLYALRDKKNTLIEIIQINKSEARES